MNKEKLVPKLRFEKFKQSETWKVIRLGENATFINGRAYSQEELLDNGKYKVLRVGNFYTNDSWYYSNFELNNKYYAEYGDLLYTWSASFGPHIWKGEKVIYHYHIWKIELNKKLDKIFLLQLLEEDKKQILSNVTGSTMVHITKSGMEEKNVIIPENIYEQQKIGIFFKKIDEMIQLQQSKVNKVKDIKSAYLSEMFPKEGEKYPKRRFEGFTEPWKTIKMREVFSTVLSGNRLPKTSLKGGNIPYILATTENNGVYARIDKETRDYHGNKMKIFNTPSISFSIDNPEAIFLQEENYFTSNIMRVLINNDLEKEEYIFFVETLRKATGGFNWGVKFSGPVVLDLDINVPFNKIEDKIDNQEIKKIGLFINELDEAEKLEKSKLEKLEKLKQAYLNDMFV